MLLRTIRSGSRCLRCPVRHNCLVALYNPWRVSCLLWSRSGSKGSAGSWMQYLNISHLQQISTAVHGMADRLSHAAEKREANKHGSTCGRKTWIRRELSSPAARWVHSGGRPPWKLWQQQIFHLGLGLHPELFGRPANHVTTRHLQCRRVCDVRFMEWL